MHTHLYICIYLCLSGSMYSYILQPKPAAINTPNTKVVSGDAFAESVELLSAVS